MLSISTVCSRYSLISNLLNDDAMRPKTIICLMQFSRFKCDPDTICLVGRMDCHPIHERMLDIWSISLLLVHVLRVTARHMIFSAELSWEAHAIRRVTVTGVQHIARSYPQCSGLILISLNISRATQNKILLTTVSVATVVASSVTTGSVGITQKSFFIADAHQWPEPGMCCWLDDWAKRRRVSLARFRHIVSYCKQSRSTQRFDSINERRFVASRCAYGNAIKQSEEAA
jgi:hypothetical protein